MLTVNFSTTARQIEQSMGDEIARLAFNGIYNPLQRLKSEIGAFVKVAVDRSPEADDLINGFLRNEFGLIEPRQNVENIIEAIITAASVTGGNWKYKVGGNFSGTIQIGVLQSNLREVLSLPDAQFESKGKHAGTVRWLSWLLLGGEGIVLDNFHVKHSSVNAQFSRTGGDALMFPGGGYSVTSSGFVPPSFSGVSGNNWLTRALEKMEQYLHPLVEAEFRRVFS